VPEEGDARRTALAIEMAIGDPTEPPPKPGAMSSTRSTVPSRALLSRRPRGTRAARRQKHWDAELHDGAWRSVLDCRRGTEGQFATGPEPSSACGPDPVTPVALIRLVATVVAPSGACDRLA